MSAYKVYLKLFNPNHLDLTKHENTSGNRVDSNTATDFSEGCIDQDSTNAENTFDTEKRDNNAEKVTENSLKGFITYSHEDTAAKDELRKTPCCHGAKKMNSPLGTMVKLLRATNGMKTFPKILRRRIFSSIWYPQQVLPLKTATKN